jgi:hypothetical protein
MLTVDSVSNDFLLMAPYAMGSRLISSPLMVAQNLNVIFTFTTLTFSTAGIS